MKDIVVLIKPKYPPFSIHANSMIMSNHIQTCPDNHHCLNGSQCVENPYEKGSYYCDCNEVIWSVRYEGLRCEHKAEIYCTGPNARDLDEWFCLNGGICHIKSNDNEENSQWACNCPDEFEGSFCQFVKGSKPNGYPFNQRSDNQLSGGSFMGGIIGSLVTLLVIGTVAFAIFYRRRKDVINRSNDTDLQLDADGALLKEAIAKSMQQATVEAHLIENNDDFNNRSKGENVAMKNMKNEGESKDEEHQVENVGERPDTRQSEAGLSYAEEEDFTNDDNSMLSFT